MNLPFNGYKTYIIAALIALTVFAKVVDWIDENAMTIILSLLGAGGMATIKHAVSKTEKTP